MIAFIELSYYMIESQLAQNTSFKPIIFEESVMLMIIFENRKSRQDAGSFPQRHCEPKTGFSLRNFACDIGSRNEVNCTADVVSISAKRPQAVAFV